MVKLGLGAALRLVFCGRAEWDRVLVLGRVGRFDRAVGCRIEPGGGELGEVVAVGRNGDDVVTTTANLHVSQSVDKRLETTTHIYSSSRIACNTLASSRRRSRKQSPLQPYANVFGHNYTLTYRADGGCNRTGKTSQVAIYGCTVQDDCSLYTFPPREHTSVDQLAVKRQTNGR